MVESGLRAASVRAPTDVIEALQLLLLVEYLEADFHTRGLAAAGLIPTADRAVFSTIAAHQTAHVTALSALIQSRSATPRSKPAFDFTAHGNVSGFAFLPTQYETFRQLAHAFEDLGVRAYKGQLTRLIDDKPALLSVLAMHSVEARHASEIRRLRGRKGWITGSSSDDLPVFLFPIYLGEDNTTQGSVNVSQFSGSAGGASAASEAFDEPLTFAQVNTILTPFLA